MKPTLGVFLLLGVCFDAHAAELSKLYPPANLQASGERYQRTTNKILDEIIWPVLLSDEKAGFGNRKPVLEFPVYAEKGSRDNPLAFYSPFDSNRVVMPVLSLKFLDDLSTAYAWLQANHYTLESISEYTAILRYGNPPASGFPPPLEALQIPPNALDRKDVDYVSLEHFVTARAFIVLHEMGHILYRHHGGRTSAESIRNEQQADRFAIDVMKRVPLLPLGMLDYFVADAHWSGSATNPGATHPMSGERVRALAGAVDNFVLAAALREFGQRLDDPDIRTGFVATGVAGDLSALGPRRPGELPHAGARSRAAGSQPFDGDYRGEVIQFLDPGAMPAEFALERHGESVTGRFTVGLGFFTIKAGRVVGNKVYFDWEFGPSYGHGVLESNVPGRFTGTWGYREARSGAGTLAGSASATTAAVQRLGR